MKLRTNEKESKSLAALIFNAYQEYKYNNYPKDPSVYVIRAHPTTVDKLKLYLDTAVIYMTEEPPTQEHPWGFQLKGDPRLEEGVVVFGPETVEILWTEGGKV